MENSSFEDPVNRSLGAATVGSVILFQLSLVGVLVGLDMIVSSLARAGSGRRRSPRRRVLAPGRAARWAGAAHVLAPLVGPRS